MDTGRSLCARVRGLTGQTVHCQMPLRVRTHLHYASNTKGHVDSAYLSQRTCVVAAQSAPGVRAHSVSQIAHRTYIPSI